MKKTEICQITQKKFSLDELVIGNMVREPIKTLIVKDYPHWSNDKYISLEILNTYRNKYITNLLEEEKGALSKLEKEVINSISSTELITKSIANQDDEKLSIGQKMADRVAMFGGSWTFIIAFGTFLALWIIINAWLLTQNSFDPYPFILLNLILSCLAAIQAPIIMMSQNRQEAKDRLRAQNDYQINLKAELEIRQLHEKVDLLLIQYGHKFFEIQQIQVELMEQILKNKQSEE